ncbi:MAG: SusD/RagB family nutrient-binding outer membrane lipoprotein [Saprospiraceae bacterium]
MFKIKLYNKFMLSLIVALLVSSCGDMFDLDINDDPNNPAKASSELLLAQAEYSLMNLLAAGTSSGSATTNTNNTILGAMGILATSDDWELPQNSYDQFWREMYAGPLKDLDGLIQDNSTATGSFQYLGIAQLLKAFAISTMVDLFGDVPYSQALQGDAESPNMAPGFDDDASVYAEAFKLIDEGIANVTNPRKAFDVRGDIIYGGNEVRWRKFGKTLKLRLYLNTRLVDAKAKENIQALITEGDLILTDADDFTFQYSKTFNATFDPRHPWYRTSYTGSNNFTYISHQFMTEMLLDKDPRFPFYFRRQTKRILNQEDPTDRNTTPCSQLTNCVYNYLVLNPSIHQQLYGTTTLSAAQKDFLAGIFGRDRADPSGAPLDGGFRTMPGVYPAGGFYDVTAPAASSTGNANRAPGGGIFPVITSVNTLYYQIEAILTLGVSGDARALFEKAMRDHIRKVVDFSVRTDAANAQRPPLMRGDGVTLDVDSYVNLWLKRYDDAPGNPAKLNVVLKQLWFSSWGNGYDIYNAFRRTGFPTTLQTPLTPVRGFPLRQPYPQEELTLNPSAASYKDIAYDRDPVFWDVN